MREIVLRGDYARLYRAARGARDSAYAPYSGFRVGAALLTADGRTVTGSNVENASYGLTVCAERVAVFGAVSAGCRDFRMLAICGPAEAACPPCGACRQVLHEFSPGMEILLVGEGAGRGLVIGLRELLPFPFPREGAESKGEDH